jgi:hypothetical protein
MTTTLRWEDRLADQCVAERARPQGAGAGTGIDRQGGELEEPEMKLVTTLLLAATCSAFALDDGPIFQCDKLARSELYSRSRRQCALRGLD